MTIKQALTDHIFQDFKERPRRNTLFLIGSWPTTGGIGIFLAAHGWHALPIFLGQICMAFLYSISFCVAESFLRQPRTR